MTPGLSVARGRGRPDVRGGQKRRTSTPLIDVHRPGGGARLIGVQLKNPYLIEINEFLSLGAAAVDRLAHPKDPGKLTFVVA